MEALTVVWALAHFNDIIYGHPVNVYTDRSAVTQLFSRKISTDALPDSILPNKSPDNANTVADALSRNIPVAAVTQVPSFLLSELLAAQRQDTVVSCHLQTRVR